MEALWDEFESSQKNEWLCPDSPVNPKRYGYCGEITSDSWRAEVSAIIAGLDDPVSDNNPVNKPSIFREARSCVDGDDGEWSKLGELDGFLSDTMPATRRRLPNDRVIGSEDSVRLLGSHLFAC